MPAQEENPDTTQQEPHRFQMTSSQQSQNLGGKSKGRGTMRYHTPPRSKIPLRV
uniref:Uncharacterized protein n=1 Tax=Anguilla anguilla TaxID=7936 RepID=A0A0E9R9U4_ANGAN